MSIQERYDEWRATADGHLVYREVLARARRWRARGFRHGGVGMIWESIRYDRGIDVGPENGYKLNDHYRSRIAREVMDNEPDLADFFEVRELRAA